MGLKQAVIVRNDLKMPKGKLAAQVAHASLEAALSAKPDVLEAWREEGAKKVVLKVESLAELTPFFKLAKANKLPTSLIKDAGRTFFDGPTVTCVGIGPADEQTIDKLTAKLHLI